MIVLLWRSGLRISEALKLKPSDVDEREGTVRVGNGKGGKSRIAVIDSEALGYLRAKALSTYMGHASVTITYDRYGHLMPGNEEEAAELADAYLERLAPSVG